MDENLINGNSMFFPDDDIFKVFLNYDKIESKNIEFICIFKLETYLIIFLKTAL